MRRSSFAITALLCAPPALSTSCSAGNSGTGIGGDDNGGSTSTSTSDGGSGAGFATGGGVGVGGGGTNDDCSEAAKLVYAIGQGNRVYSFHPPTPEVAEGGTIARPQNGGLG